MAHTAPATRPELSFIVTPLSPRTWAVGCPHRPIPGAFLRTRKAALDYVYAIADAAGLQRFNVEIAGEDRAGRNGRRHVRARGGE